MISGLAIEIDDKHKYSEDFEKLTDFFKNPDFEIYNETAKKFGFEGFGDSWFRSLKRLGPSFVGGLSVLGRQR